MKNWWPGEVFTIVCMKCNTPMPVFPLSKDIPGSQETAVRSMTGYARTRKPTAIGELTISLRSVNHRGLDLHFHQSSDFLPFENAMRGLLKQELGRGHVEIRVSLAREARHAQVSYNRELLARHIAAFEQARDEFGLAGQQPDLNALLRLPGGLDDEERPDLVDSGFEPVLLEALSACARELNSCREREGGDLRAEMEREVAAIVTQTSQMIALRADAQPQFHRRLTERLSDLLNGAGIDERRIMEEAAVLADRSDVQEELTRLTIHARELSRILEEGGEVGKRLDFLLQEMNRETNTTLAKTSGAADAGMAITTLALATKANIEKIREQALNLE